MNTPGSKYKKKAHVVSLTQFKSDEKVPEGNNERFTRLDTVFKN